MAQSARATFVFWALFVTLATRVMAEGMDAESQEETSGLLNRSSRGAFIEKEGFTDAEKAAITNQHNVFRGQLGASNMLRVDWDPKIEKFSQFWANKCVFKHSEYSDRADISTYHHVGENIIATYDSVLSDAASIVRSWHNEIKDYNYDTLRCTPGAMCGHYTQVVWADTVAIGCGIKSCSLIGVANMKNAYFMPCNYGPPGNYPGVKPFKKGPACSECPETHKNCVGGLCSLPGVKDPNRAIQNYGSQSGVFVLFTAVLGFVLA